MEREKAFRLAKKALRSFNPSLEVAHNNSQDIGIRRGDGFTHIYCGLRIFDAYDAHRGVEDDDHPMLNKKAFDTLLVEFHNHMDSYRMEFKFALAVRACEQYWVNFVISI